MPLGETLSDDDSQGPDHQHDEQDWEAQKENFRICYMDNNMPRKAAAQYMKDHFNFDATPRQWERKIKQWGFSKYSSREERIRQIASTGKTVFEVSKPGRRPRAHSSNNLHPNEDRNLRRFARREVSRSRSRPRSHSFTDRQRPHLRAESTDLSDTTVGFDDDFQFPEPTIATQTQDTIIQFPAALRNVQSEQQIPFPYLNIQTTSGLAQQGDASTHLNFGDQQWHSAPSSAVLTQYGLPGTDNFPEDILSSRSSLEYDQSAPNDTFLPTENEPSLEFRFVNNPIVPPNFDPYDASGQGITMPNHYGSGMMNDQSTFDPCSTDVQQLVPSDQPIVNTDPIFAFDVVDTEAMTGALLMENPIFGPATKMQNDFTNTPGEIPTTTMGGMLQTDVGPLMEEYTRSVQAIALWGLKNPLYAQGHENKLAADLNQTGKNVVPHHLLC
jgi:hypothetical protein